jgi:hypothetical protein
MQTFKSVLGLGIAVLLTSVEALRKLLQCFEIGLRDDGYGTILHPSEVVDSYLN